MIFSFGKYKGKNITEVPRVHIDWLISVRKKDLAELELELQRREAMELSSLSITEQMIHAGYRSLAKKMHPDVGGETVDMQLLNASKEALLQVAGRLIKKK